MFHSFLLFSCNILQDTDSTNDSSGKRCGPGVEVNVLFIAESEFEDSEISQTTLDLGCRQRMNLKVSVFAPVGYSLSELESDGNLANLITKTRWDFVFISEHSNLVIDPAYDHLVSSLLPLISLKNKILNSSPEADIFLVQNWSRADSFSTDSSLIQDRYSDLGIGAGLNIVEANKLWEEVYTDPLVPFAPSELWLSNSRTPSDLGEMLVSGLIFIEISKTAITKDNLNNPSNSIIYIKDEINSFSGY